MKGIIYLVEIAISAVLIVIVLSFFLTAQNVRTSFERADLISIGNNILLNLKYNNKIDNLINSDASDINKIKPPNVDFVVGFAGTPKPDIKVGCFGSDACTEITNNLTPAYVNGRTINFDVEDMTPFLNNLNHFDSLVFMDQATLFKSPFVDSLKNFIKNGGTVVSINGFGTYDQEFYDFFNLTQTGVCPSGNYLKFKSYDPANELIPKYFLGLGFDIKIDNGNGIWYIWEEPKTVISTPPTVTIDGKRLSEGDTFSLTGPDGSPHTFKVKKISSSRVDIQALDTTFPFEPFSPCWIRGNNVVSDPLNIGAAMTTNNTAIWMSDFSTSDEYRTLIKAAISSRAIEWNLNTPATNKETVSVSTFANKCCDMLETYEVILTLWYRF